MTNITYLKPINTPTGGGMGLGMVLEAGSKIIDATIQQGANAVNSRRGYKYNVKSMREQADILNRQTEFNMEKQKELWDYTNYENQKKHLKAAGLNPALFYGMSGGGGTTAQVDTGSIPSGHSTPQAAPSAGGMDIRHAMELALLKAQKENIEADTHNKEASAFKTEGVDIQKGMMETSVLAQEYQIKLQEVKKLKRENKIGNETAEAQIKQIKAEAINEVLKTSLIKAQTGNIDEDTKLKQSQVKLTDQHTLQSIEEIAQNWKKIEQKDREIKLDAIIKQYEAWYKGLNVGFTTIANPEKREEMRKAIEEVLNKLSQ